MGRKALGAAAGAYALWRLIGPEVPPRFQGVQERPSSQTGRTVLVGRHEFVVRKAGESGAPPVLLIHGWVYDAVATWHRVVPVLAEDHRVVTIELRNHGRSDRIRGSFSIADLADEVAGVMDASGLASAAVVGYSLGGMTAQELARRHPAKVDRLVLAATAARPTWFPQWFGTGLFLLGRALGRIEPLILPRIGYHYLMNGGVVPPEHGAWLWESLLDRDVNLHYEAAFAINRFDSRSWIGRVDVPALCIIPTSDQLIPAKNQRQTASLLKQADVLELPGARHEAVLTHAGEIAAAIREFAARSSQP